MAKEKTGRNKTDSIHGYYLERPRLHALLKKAMNYPLVIVCAGSGYGKTHAVHSFLDKYETQDSPDENNLTHTAWLQISERDNITARFWESLSGMSPIKSHEAGLRIKEIEFPGTEEEFTAFNILRQKLSEQPGKHIRVLDDFHFIHNQTILRFFERMIISSPPNMTIIMITRKMPEINIGMMMHEHVFTIQEETLRFTEDEIARYFFRKKLPVTSEDIHNIYNDTQGWAFAINLIARSLAKNRKYERYALGAMKKNIFRFIEAEILLFLSEPFWRFLLRISMIDRLAADFLKTLVKDDAFLKELEMLSAYIRYDFYQDMYIIQHLFRSYLLQKQEQILTDEERRETCEAAAVWCNIKGYHSDALSYYEKAGNYNAIIEIIISLNIQIPYNLARYALEIFNRMPENVKHQNPMFPSMYIKLKLNLGQFDEADALARQYAADCEKQFETPQRNRALSAIYFSWSVLRMTMCTYTDIYDFDIYGKKMAEYFDKNPFKLIGTYKSILMTSRASLVGTNRPGAMEEYIAAVSRMVPYFSHVFNGFHEGFEELVNGELCFYRMEFDEAQKYLNQSIEKAQKNDQYVTQNRAMVYLMHIDLSRMDIESAGARLREMEALLSEKDYSIRYTMYDIAYSFYQLALGQPEKIPEWLKSDFTLYKHPSFLENYANRIRIRYHYQTKHYNSLLAFIENSMDHMTILLDKIELKIFHALSLYHFKRYNEAITVFTESYNLARSNRFNALFVQFAKEMRTLSTAALKQGETCLIPKDWLENINHKSSSLAKKKTKMISKYRLANNLENTTMLTEREISILKDLSSGFSRSQIASSRNLSVNTIKMSVNKIYDKLGVFSLGEAIRTAADSKII
ncbi:MAG: LuxR C-terminal-related transcriptional regulator [Treponema sp.]|nr:LuxR C-terminal-related transcriptional regulator [Treponema sp.]MCL2272012.1 LuxR C-terminal-related transcriptional regulator [Treponema sp.]